MTAPDEPSARRHDEASPTQLVPLQREHIRKKGTLGRALKIGDKKYHFVIHSHLYILSNVFMPSKVSPFLTTWAVAWTIAKRVFLISNSASSTESCA